MKAAPEKAYEKHAWKLLFVSSTILAIYSFLFLFILFPRPPAIVGKTMDEIIAFSPGLAYFLEVTTVNAGVAMLGLGLFGMVTARFSYRKGERWAWYTLWYLVVFSVVGVVVDFSVAGSTASTFIIVAVVSILGQLLSYRKFFPRRSEQTQAPSGVSSAGILSIRERQNLRVALPARTSTADRPP